MWSQAAGGGGVDEAAGVVAVHLEGNALFHFAECLSREPAVDVVVGVGPGNGVNPMLGAFHNEVGKDFFRLDFLPSGSRTEAAHAVVVFPFPQITKLGDVVNELQYGRMRYVGILFAAFEFRSEFGHGGDTVPWRDMTHVYSNVRQQRVPSFGFDSVRQRTIEQIHRWRSCCWCSSGQPRECGG